MKMKKATTTNDTMGRVTATAMNIHVNNIYHLTSHGHITA